MTVTSRTQVGIIGAGPAGLMLGQLLHLEGIDSVILENRSRQYVVERVRAGVLEQGTVDLMREAGVGGRLAREGMRHDGIYLAFNGTRHRIDMAALTGGRAITIYGQNEVVHDLVEARLETGRPLHFEVEDVSVHDLESARAPHPLPEGRRRARDRVRHHRRLRRFSWHLPPGDPREPAAPLRARVSVRMAGHPRRSRALLARARVQPA